MALTLFEQTTRPAAAVRGRSPGGVLTVALLACACGGGAVNRPARPPSPTSSQGPSEHVFQVTMTVPSRVGDRYRWSGWVAKRTEVHLERASGETDERSAFGALVLEGTVEVLAVDAQGRPTEQRFTAQQGFFEDGRSTRGVLEYGSVVRIRIAHAPGEVSSVEVEDARLAPGDQELLEMTFVNLADASFDEEAFGSDETRRLGDAWSARTDVLEEAVGPIALRLQGAQLSGQARLVELSRLVTTPPSLVVETSWSATGFGGFEADLPAGARVLASRLEVRTRRHVPIDGSLGWLSSSHTQEMQVRLLLDGPNGREVMTSRTEITHETSRGRRQSGAAPLASQGS